MSNKSEIRGLFTLFGRLFEEYIERLISESVEVSKILYNIFPEFIFRYKKQDIRSSDLYLQLGRQILVIECKSKRVLRDTKILADEKSSFIDFNKVVIEPINQASTRMQQLNEIDYFGSKLRLTILTVSYNGFPKIEDFHCHIEDDWSNFIWDYFSIVFCKIIIHKIAIATTQWCNLICSLCGHEYQSKKPAIPRAGFACEGYHAHHSM